MDVDSPPNAGSSSLCNNIIKGILFFGLLYCFLVAIKLLGGSFKLLGQDIATELIETTSNPFAGLFIGILATSIVQSSSVTTSMVVGLVSGNVLPIETAVPMIMGANIGTAVTCAIVSLGHISRNDEFERAYAGANMHDMFNLLSVAIILPIQLSTGFLHKTASYFSDLIYGSTTASTFTSPIKTIVSPAVKLIQHALLDSANLSKPWAGGISIIIAIVLIFLALSYMVKCMRAITASKLEKSIHSIFSTNIYLTLLLGAGITAIIQSSSITTSILIPMLGAGLISLEQAFPMTVGANLGTTVTALLASLAGNQSGLTIAFVHLLFNICGTVILFVPPWMRKIPVAVARTFARIFVNNKKYAIVFIVLVFFVIPIVGMVLTR